MAAFRLRINFKDVFKAPELYIIIIAVIIRIALSINLGLWADLGPHDGAYFIDAAYPSLIDVFPSPQFALIKNISYTAFLKFVDFTEAPYPLILSLVWVVAALMAYIAFRKITSNRAFLAFSFLFVLFTPAAFDWYIGTRLYRNSIIAPFILIVFLIMLLIYFSIINEPGISVKRLLIENTVLGFAFTFAYYLKEDGVWLLVCLIGYIIICAAIMLHQYLKHKRNEDALTRSEFAKRIVTLCVSLAVFLVCTNIYKAFNYQKYGIYEVNSRTEGELGRYVELVYDIKSDFRTASIWAPADAIDKTYEVSKTFQEYPQIIENIRYTPWFGGNIYENPIKGDFLTWVLRDAVYEAGLWSGDGAVNDLFAQINFEIERAFETGELEKDDKFKPLASTGGFTKEEILSLKKIIDEEFNIQINLEMYEPGGKIFVDEGIADFENIYAMANEITNWYVYYSDEQERAIKSEEIQPVNEVIKNIFSIYSIMNRTLCLCAAGGTIAVLFYAAFNRIKKTKVKNGFLIPAAFMTVLLAMLCICYAFGIAWFTNFLNIEEINVMILKFYSVGLIPMLSIIEIFGAYYLTVFIKWWIKRPRVSIPKI